MLELDNSICNLRNNVECARDLEPCSTSTSVSNIESARLWVRPRRLLADSWQSLTLLLPILLRFKLRNQNGVPNALAQTTWRMLIGKHKPSQGLKSGLKSRPTSKISMWCWMKRSALLPSLMVSSSKPCGPSLFDLVGTSQQRVGPIAPML